MMPSFRYASRVSSTCSARWRRADSCFRATACPVRCSHRWRRSFSAHHRSRALSTFRCVAQSCSRDSPCHRRCSSQQPTQRLLNVRAPLASGAIGTMFSRFADVAAIRRPQPRPLDALPRTVKDTLARRHRHGAQGWPERARACAPCRRLFGLADGLNPDGYRRRDGAMARRGRQRRLRRDVSALAGEPRLFPREGRAGNCSGAASSGRHTKARHCASI